ncbi:MAG: SH3 domain-containing protein, partial [Desulfobacteraceae bacterium]
RKTRVRETTETTSSPVKVPEHLLSTVTVITKLANIRERPTTRSNVISVAKKDQEFWLLNKKKSWYQIWLSDLEKKGWIYKTLVTKNHKK